MTLQPAGPRCRHGALLVVKTFCASSSGNSETGFKAAIYQRVCATRGPHQPVVSFRATWVGVIINKVFLSNQFYCHSYSNVPQLFVSNRQVLAEKYGTTSQRNIDFNARLGAGLCWKQCDINRLSLLIYHVISSIDLFAVFSIECRTFCGLHYMFVDQIASVSERGCSRVLLHC